ncbi:hypothetical protein AWV80_26785 [Cupriavidus sp. UYMU48A]|nr:hypothetical protein AWV80_26785 [Cupriavidus sp. UYMU48A]
MLSSQLMGFYTPSQLIQDAKRHGVEVLPAMSPSAAGLVMDGSIARPARVKLELSLPRGMRNEATQH